MTPSPDTLCPNVCEWWRRVMDDEEVPSNLVAAAEDDIERECRKARAEARLAALTEAADLVTIERERWTNGAAVVACESILAALAASGPVSEKASDLVSSPEWEDDLSNDEQMRRAGFNGYYDCPADGCPTPYLCSERGDCPLVIDPEEPTP